MLKLLKYEIKGNYRVTGWMILGVIFINLLAAIERARISDFGVWMVSLFGCTLVIFITFALSVEAFNDDIYSERACLKFTLPFNSSRILGAKLIFSVMQLLIIEIVAVGFLYANGKCWAGYVLAAKPLYGFILMTSLMFIGLLVIVYFCTAISQSTIRNKKITKPITFGMVAVFYVLLVWLGRAFDKIFPKATLDIKTICITNISKNSVSSGVGNVNAIAIIINLVLLIAMFAATVYLMNKKMEF